MRATICASGVPAGRPSTGRPQKILDTFCETNAFASEAIPATGSHMSEACVCVTIVGQYRFGVISGVILSIQAHVVV